MIEDPTQYFCAHDMLRDDPYRRTTTCGVCGKVWRHTDLLTLAAIKGWKVRALEAVGCTFPSTGGLISDAGDTQAPTRTH